MRRSIYIFIIMMLGLWSCSMDPDEFQIQDKDCIAITVYNTSMATKANGDITNDRGTERERLLTRLDIFLYPEGKTDEPCLFYKYVSGISNTSGLETVPVYVSEEMAGKLFPDNATQCDVYVVANMPDDVTFNGTETVAEIQAEAIRSNEFKDVVASDGSFVQPEKFIMASGVCKVTKSGDNITGSLPLKRAASKITMTVLVPDYINVTAHDASNGEDIPEIWHPYFIDDTDPKKGIHTMHIGFHKGLLQTVVDGTNNIVTPAAEGTMADPNRFETLYTEKFIWKETISKTFTEGEKTITKNYHKYSCDISFYSYAFNWEGADNDVEAPYFTLMLPWKRDADTRYTTYYYQVVVNGLDQKIERNCWYDINLNIGVLGSRDYNHPATLDDLSCYILDWSDGDAGLKEDVDLKEWRYLVVPETYIEMNNTDKGYLPFEASHKIAWALEWPGSPDPDDPLQGYNAANSYSAYYINCRGTSPVSVQLTDVNNTSFAISENGETLDLTHALPQNIYTPMYFHLKLWLDLTPNGVLDEDETSFVEKIVFVQYPPIYIVPSKSASKSVFVNGKNDYTTANSAISYNNGKYVLAWAPGTSDKGDHMYVINVSRFQADDTFGYRDDNNYAYLIGDPRVEDNDTNMNDDGYDMSSDWVAANDVNGNSRKLQNYYPTAKQGDVFRVISPKFRVASFLGGQSNGCTPEGAAMRCASYQEAGYPAGRWRLPTTAEIQFVISLQQKEVIQDIFYGSNYYYSSTDQVRNYNGTIDIREIEWDNSSFNGSVRCVYDEWYWGSEREAVENSGFDGGYEFTWGDAPR